MNTRKLLGLVASGALVISAMLASTGGVLAAANTQYWAGNGSTNGEINNNDCADDSSAHQLWIWTGDADAVWISVDGEVVPGVQKGQGTFQFKTGWHDIGDLTTGQGGNVFVTYDGAVDGNAVLALSHGCPGETSSSSSSSESSSSSSVESSSSSVESSSSSVESSSSSVESSSSSVESSSSSESHSQTVSGTSTSVSPTEPNTATIGDSGTAHGSSAAWLLLAALGALFGSILVLTPSRAKNRE